MRLIWEKTDSLLYKPLLEPFKKLSNAIRCILIITLVKTFTEEIRHNIVNRVSNYSFYFSYFLSHNCYPPQPYCTRLFNSMTQKPNPNRFDYFMTLEEKSSYQLPSVFTQIGCFNRNGSSFRICLFIFLEHRVRASSGHISYKSPSYLINSKTTTRIRNLSISSSKLFMKQSLAPKQTFKSHKKTANT